MKKPSVHVSTHALVLGLLAGSPVAAIATQNAVPAPAGQEAATLNPAQPSESAVLIQALQNELATLPPNATPQDIEATIVFVLSQREYPDPTVVEALDSFNLNEATSSELRAAANRVQLALVSRKLTRGTAAITGGGFSFTGSGFTAPVTATGGGGTATYTS